MSAEFEDPASLRRVYRAPYPLVMEKGIDHVDDGVASFLAATTLIVVATSGPGGGDASPRGGPPGFVHVVDRGSIAFADLAGNNRLDTYSNLTESPEVGILGIVPGLEETLRINGRGRLTEDEAIRAAVAIDGRVPKIAVVVDVVECYIHCGKALRRSGIWAPDTWPTKAEAPDPAAVLVDHLALDVEPALVQADLEAGYQATLWATGASDAD